MDSLPEEITMHIFAMLPVKDRKNVRLCCKRWNSYCLSYSIRKNEKFSFRSDLSIPDIKRILPRKYYTRMTIEFHDVSIYKLPAVTWSNHGHRIESLALCFCRLDYKSIFNMIVHCENLDTLYLHLLTREFQNDESMEGVMKLFQELHHRNIRRTKLRTLWVYSHYRTSEDESIHLSDLLQLYPCITTLYIGGATSRSHENIAVQGPFEEMNLNIFRNIHHYCEQIDTLCFWLPTYGTWIRSYYINERKDRLKVFDAILLYSFPQNKIMFSFISAQKNLREVILKFKFIHCGNNEFLVQLIFHILQNCPYLKKLIIDASICNTNFILSFTRDKFFKFLALISRLEDLSLMFIVLDEPSAACTSPQAVLQSCTAFALKSLELYMADDVICDTFLKYCFKLRDLEIKYDPSGYKLPSTLKHNLMNLQTLILRNVEKCDDSRTIDGYSLQPLGRLQHLGLYDSSLPNSSCEIPKRVLLGMQFPQLKFLGLGPGVYEKLSREALLHLACTSPAIEVLSIYENGMSNLTRSKTFEFCINLKNLYHLIYGHHVQHYENLERVDFRQLFYVCRHLKYISDCLNTTLIFDRDTYTIFASSTMYYGKYLFFL